MRKRWMYVFAFSLMLGATPVFTGCIDNDEPAGISELRGAKAELLKAKAAVEAARVAEIEANAALINAKAKVQEAKAANELAQAKINEAIAKQEELKAQILETKDELKKAELQHQLQVWEREQKEWEAEQAQAALDREHANKEWEVAYNTMLANYEKVLVELAKAKNELAAAQQAVLNPYITRLDYAKAAYEQAYDEHQTAYYKLVDAQKAVEDNEANKEYLTRELEWNLAEAKASLEGKKKALETAQAELAEAENMQGSELYQKKLALEAQINAIQVELNNLLVSTVENVNKIEADELPAYNEMANANAEAQWAPRKIDAFKADFTANVFPWDYIGKVEELPESTYTINDVSLTTGHYQERLNQLDAYIRLYESWLRDGSDNVWTNEQISQLKAEKAEVDKDVDEVAKLWQEAINAYQAGNYNNYDPTKIDGYAVLDNAVIAFNEAIESYNEIIDKIIANNEAIIAAEKTYNEALAAAGEKKDEAYKIAAEEAAQKRKDASAKKKEADDKLLAAMQAEQDAYDAYVKDDTNQAKIDAWKQAQEAKKDAQKNKEVVYSEYSENGILQAKQKAEAEADNICAKEQTEAKKTFDTLKEAKDNENTALRGTLSGEATDAVNTATTNAVNAFNNYKERAESVGDGTSVYVLFATAYDITNKTASDAEGKLVGGLTTAELTKMDRDKLKQLLISRSNALYGKASWGNNGYGQPNAVFEPISAETIIAMVKETGLTGADYFNEFKNYGIAGKALGIQEQIKWAEGVVADNGESVKALIAQTQEAYDKLKAEGETALATWEANVAAADALWASINDKVVEAWVPYNNKQAELQPVQEVLNAVNSALYNLVGSISSGAATDLENYIRNCKKAVADEEKNVYEAETKVQEKQKLLNDWNAGSLTILQTREREYEAAQHDLEVAQSNLAEARANLEAIMEQLSVDGLSE